MPSTAVHLALGALLAAALLDDDFGGRTLAIVLAATAAPDLDTFLGLVVPGAHRAALHTLLVPLLLAALVAYDTRVRDRSALRDRGAVRLAWVALAAYVLAGIAPDLFWNGANLLYPLHDQFYALHGDILLSTERGFVQTVWQPARSTRGTTGTVHYATGVNPSPGGEPAGVERVFPIARGGLQVLLLLVATVVTAVRLWEARKA